MNEVQHNWIRERATKLESCRPQVPLSLREQQAVDRIVGDAAVFVPGNMTHGSERKGHAVQRQPFPVGPRLARPELIDSETVRISRQ
jgi:hypothetical protein